MTQRTKILLAIVGALLLIYLYTHFAGYLTSIRSRNQASPVAVTSVVQKDIVIPCKQLVRCSLPPLFLLNP